MLKKTAQEFLEAKKRDILQRPSQSTQVSTAERPTNKRQLKALAAISIVNFMLVCPITFEHLKMGHHILKWMSFLNV